MKKKMKVYKYNKINMINLNKQQKQQPRYNKQICLSTTTSFWDTQNTIKKNKISKIRKIEQHNKMSTILNDNYKNIIYIINFLTPSSSPMQ